MGCRCSDYGSDPGALAGDYAGAQTSVALGVAASHVLFGGFHKSIAGNRSRSRVKNGLNVAARIAAMRLHTREAIVR